MRQTQQSLQAADRLMQMNGVMSWCCEEVLNKEIRRQRKKPSRSASEKVILKQKRCQF